MALIEDSSVEGQSPAISPLLYQADNFTVASTQKSVLDSASDFLTKGTPIIIRSALNSFYNTGVEVANWFGADATKASMEKQLMEADSSGDLLKYYSEREGMLEAGGLAVGSFVPGLGATKALRLLQSAKLPLALSKATNLLPGAVEERTIATALDQINRGTATLYGSVNRDKLVAIGAGYADQALQAAAWELATVATMKANPTIDKDNLGDIISHTFSAALFGAGLGGTIEAILINRQFKGALLTKEAEEKIFEVSKRLGIGDFMAGDRAAELINSLDKIPQIKAADTLSAQAKLERNKQSGYLDAKKMLLKLGPEGDNSVTNEFLDSILEVRDKFGAPNEYLYDMLARLNKVKRINDTAAEVDPSIFYVNRFLESNKSADFNTIITKTPHETADLSLAYRIRKEAENSKPLVSHFIAGAEDTSEASFLTKEAAWDAGSDIYIDNRLRIHINPNSSTLERAPRPGEDKVLPLKTEAIRAKTGSLPEAQNLSGASVYFNRLSGSITNRAFSVVGDISNDIKLDNNGLRVGAQSFAQQVGKEYKPTALSTTEASARFTWADLRGLKANDSIMPDDLPLMEQVAKDYNKAKELDIRYNSLPLPENPEAFVSELQASKNTHIAELQKNPKITSREIAIKTNTPEDYAVNSAGQKNLSDISDDISRYRKLNTVKLSYDIGHTTADADGMIARGSLDVQYRINLAKQQAEHQVANFFGPDFDKYVITMSAADADARGAGPGFIYSANADYGSFAQKAEYTGANSSEFIKSYNNKALEKLASSVYAIRADEAAGAELGFLTNIMRRTGERYRLVPDEMSAKKLGEGTTNILALEKSFKFNKQGVLLDWDHNYKPDNTPQTAWVSGKELLGKSAETAPKGQATFYQVGDKVSDFAKAHIGVNDERLIHHNNWLAAQGINHSVGLGSMYAPPINTRKFPFVALVRELQGNGSAGSSVASVIAEDAKTLEQKVAALQGKYEIYFKGTSKKYHEVLGDYDYNMNLVQNTVDSALKREGVLSDVFPNTDTKSILEEYTDWHQRQNSRLIRNHIELANAQTFAELRAIGERYTLAETSKIGNVLASFTRTADNPYNQYIKTALAISPKEEYRLWADANEKAEAFFGTAFRAARSLFPAAARNLISFEDATNMAKKFGLGNVYGDTIDGMKNYGIANKLPPDRYLTKFVSLANSALAATTIRLDAFQTIINAVSTPVLLASETNAAIKKLIQTELPDGSGRMIPAPSKVMYQSVQDYFGDTGKSLLDLYHKENVGVRKLTSDYHDLVDMVSLTDSQKFADFEKYTKNIVDKVAKLTLSDRTEEFVRFVAARTGHQIFEAAGQEGNELWANVRTFVNRVHGNYIASQRPVAFQGPLGQAIGLFQTYQFNLMQQVFRHVENSDKKSLAMLFGLQSSLFGLQGLPGFQAINTHIVGNASNNPDHTDLYSSFPTLLDRKAGDYLLYGTVSNWLGTGLYTRGDIQPRQITILPVNPLDYPAVSGGVRFLSNLYNALDKIKDNGNLKNTITQGLEHNGISRPLTGISQVVQGYTTTSQGSLISASSDYFSMVSAARMMGARPLDEAITMDALYRKTAYQAKDNERMRDLGEAVKSTLIAGGNPTDEQLTSFMDRYAASGGRIEHFSKKMLEWTKDANMSQANKIFQQLRNPINQNMMKIMGGQPLPDFSTTPANTSAAPSG